MTSARAIDLRSGLTPSAATSKVISELRKSVAGPGPDRFISPELEAADALVRSGRVSAVAREVFAELR